MGSIGILGGTFDPVHHGHLITAQSLIEQRKLEKIIFIPCFISAHKLDMHHSSAGDRLEMVRLAVEDRPHFEYSDFEVRRSEVSYTIDTLKELSRSYSDIELIIGYDNLLKFDTWKEPDEILKMAKLIVMDRNHDKDAVKHDRFYDAATFVKTPRIDISATEIRMRVRNNLPIDFLVPEKIKKYILKNNLYRD